jgi:hypothetical protein
MGATSKLLTQTLGQAGEFLRDHAASGKPMDIHQLMSDITLKVTGRSILG